MGPPFIVTSTHRYAYPAHDFIEWIRKSYSPWNSGGNAFVNSIQFKKIIDWILKNGNQTILHESDN